MRRRPYRHGQKLTLADHLAIDRTILSNERTGLAYARTALAMIIVGGTCLKFFDSWYMWMIGGAFIAGAVFVSVRGVMRYTQTARYLAAALEEQTGAPEHPLKETVKESHKDSADADAKGSQATTATTR